MGSTEFKNEAVETREDGPGNGKRRIAEEEIIIAGMSGKFPESDNVEEFWRNLIEGNNMITSDDRRWDKGVLGDVPWMTGKLKDVERFDATFFGVHPKQAEVMDPQHRLLLELTHEAILDAGFNPQELSGSDTGVFIGQTFGELRDMEIGESSGYHLLGNLRALLPNRISYAFNLKGPSYCLDTACSSGLVAMDQAAAAISSGQCQAAIVAATNLLLDPTTSLQFHKLSVLSPVGQCRAFDAQGMGYVRSEAAVVMVLMKRSTARRCYASIVNCSSNNDGYKSQGITYPSGNIQKELIQSVFKEIKLRPQQITYVEAHGTGTKAGDPQELGSVADIFCDGRKNGMLAVGSVKSNMGHAEASSTLCSVVKVLAAMENEMLPANLHYEQPNPDIPSLHDGRIQVVDKNTPWSGDYAAINSFGIGGANAHLVLKRNQKSKDRTTSGQNIKLPRIIVVSARTRQATENFIKKILDKDIDNEFCALLYKISSRHIAGYNFRGYTIINGSTQGKIQIEEMDIRKREVWWVFSGMGSQWCGMGKDLMPLRHFSDALEDCARALAPHGVDLIHLISSPTEEAFNQIVNCFVAIAAIQVGLVDVMKAVGMEPDGIFGHSVGELGCAYADGTLTREQTILAAYLRGVAVKQAKLQPGAMASIGLSWEEAVKRCPSDIQAACHNSNSNITISGPPQSIQEFTEKMKKEGIFTKAVQSNNIAFHSKYIAPAGPILRQNLNKLIGEGKPRNKRWLSSSVPESCWESKLASHSSCDYHVNNLLSPVLFKQCMDRIPENAVLIEVSPHSLLLSLLRRENSSKKCQAVGLIDKNSEDTLHHLIDSLGRFVEQAFLSVHGSIKTCNHYMIKYVNQK